MPNGEKLHQHEPARGPENPYRKPLGEIRRMFCFDRGETDVGAAVDKMARFAIDQVVQIQQGILPPSRYRAPILIEEGPPLSAKTFTMRELIRPSLQYQFMQNDTPIRQTHIHWDTIEADLIAAGIIAPEPRQPFSPAQLRTVGTFVSLLIAQGLRRDTTLPVRDIEAAILHKYIVKTVADRPEAYTERVVETFAHLAEKHGMHYDEKHPFTFITVDKPGGAGIENIAMKEYGNTTVTDLLHGKYPFIDVKREDYYLGTVGLVGGVSMDLMIEYREGINTARSLQEANDVRGKYGFPLFADEEIWHRHQGGGSIAQTKAARSRTYGLVNMLFAQRAHPGEPWNLDRFRNTQLLPQYVTDILAFGLSINNPAIKTMHTLMQDASLADVRQDIARARAFGQLPTDALMFHTAYKAGTGAVLAYNFGMYEEQPHHRPDVAVIAQTTAPIMARAA